MMQEDEDQLKREATEPVAVKSIVVKTGAMVPKAEKPHPARAARPAAKPSRKPAAKPSREPAAKPAPKPAPKPAAKIAGKPVAKKAAKASVKSQARAATRQKPAAKAPGPDRRLAGIRAAAAELSKALEAIQTARSGLEESFAHAAAGNLSRAQGALGALRRLSESVPLLDVRRLERELAVLVEDVGDLRKGEGKGRKRDLLAVDKFLGDAAARLELASTSAAGTHMDQLAQRLSGLEALRRSHQAAITDRFRARLDRSRKVLGAVPDSCVRLDGRGLDRLSRELQSSLGLVKALPVGRLSGKPSDLYGIDGLLKRLDRRMERVQALLAHKKEPSGG